MSHPLLIGAQELQKLAALKEHAEKNQFSMDDMLDRMNGAPAPGDQPEFTCIIPVGFKVVYSIEQHPTKKLRHLSMSSPRENKYPTEEAVKLVMKRLGFTTEELTVGNTTLDEQENCIHVFEPFDQ